MNWQQVRQIANMYTVTDIHTPTIHSHIQTFTSRVSVESKWTFHIHSSKHLDIHMHAWPSIDEDTFYFPACIWMFDCGNVFVFIYTANQTNHPSILLYCKYFHWTFVLATQIFAVSVCLSFFYPSFSLSLYYIWMNLVVLVIFCFRFIPIFSFFCSCIFRYPLYFSSCPTGRLSCHQECWT